MHFRLGVTEWSKLRDYFPITYLISAILPYIGQTNSYYIYTSSK